MGIFDKKDPLKCVLEGGLMDGTRMFCNEYPDDYSFSLPEGALEGTRVIVTYYRTEEVQGDALIYRQLSDLGGS